jgi:adenine-specific DNA glycosylase
MRAIAATPQHPEALKLHWFVCGNVWEIAGVECVLETVRKLAEELVTGDPELHASSLNQGLMELGATLCTVASPDCGQCPVKAICMAYKEVSSGVRPWKADEEKVPQESREDCHVCSAVPAPAAYVK